MTCAEWLDRCITHSGDEQTGERDGLDEIVWITRLGFGYLSMACPDSPG